MSTYTTDGDWLEDAKEENGRYYNTCFKCKRAFVGHKRRVLCKICAGKPPKEIEP